jgi:hypothetical protein
VEKPNVNPVSKASTTMSPEELLNLIAHSAKKALPTPVPATPTVKPAQLEELWKQSLRSFVKFVPQENTRPLHI